jgi:large subunit ribosomal protein L6
MSRIGLKPIDVPSGVQLKLDGNVIRIKGPQGELTQEIPEGIKIVQNGTVVTVERPNDDGYYRSLHGLTRSLIANMVEGVTKGFAKTLEINGVGYRAAMQGKKLVLTIGYSHPVEFDARPGIEFEVPAPNRIIVKGANKQQVGQMAAEIRGVRPPEPYKGKGIKYATETIRRKAGKAGKVGK